MKNLQYLDDISTVDLQKAVLHLLNTHHHANYTLEDIRLQDWGFSGPYFTHENVFPFKWMDGRCAYGSHLPAYVEMNGYLTRCEMASDNPLVAAWKTIVAKYYGTKQDSCIFVPKEFA